MTNTSIKIDKNTVIIISLVLFAIALRLVPHPPNFSPIGAVGLFAGCYLSLKRFWLIPLAALFISDFFLGFYNVVSMTTVYVSFLISAIIGQYFLRVKRTNLKIASAAFLSATQFFMFTNFGVWLSGTIYQLNLAGLIECYVMAIPFYGNTLIGELFYTAILFSSYYLFNSIADRNTAVSLKK